jgi:FHA domain-containing protein
MMDITTRRIGNIKEDRLNITSGTARITLPQVYVHIVGVPEPISLKLSRPMALGRASTDEPIDIDLNPYKALEKGVSRRHIVLERTQESVTVMDLGSINGTYLNGQKLQPFQKRVVRDGDEIRLGNLSLRIYF